MSERQDYLVQYHYSSITVANKNELYTYSIHLVP